MSDAQGFMVAAYVLTVVVLGGYALLLWTRARAARSSLEALRQESSLADTRAPARDQVELEAVGGSHVRA